MGVNRGTILRCLCGVFDNETKAIPDSYRSATVFDELGTLFFSNVFENDPSPLNPNEEACYISHDDGNSWNDPVYVAGDSSNGSGHFTTSLADRDYIAADRDSSSKFFGNVYIGVGRYCVSVLSDRRVSLDRSWCELVVAGSRFCKYRIISRPGSRVWAGWGALYYL